MICNDIDKLLQLKQFKGDKGDNLFLQLIILSMD